MNLIQSDFFNYNFLNKFDGIITDIPYKNCIKNKLNEENFDLVQFLTKSYSIVKDNSFLIMFSNFRMIFDIMKICEQNHLWNFHTYQIWNKEPVRNWISWSLPLRTCEFIIYLTKGKFNFSFKTGIEKPKVNRTSFGGTLKDTSKNMNEVSYEMFSEIINISSFIKNRKHPTEKPIEFSEMFKKIVGDKFVLDCCCGTGNLIKSFTKSLGLDIIKYW